LRDGAAGFYELVAGARRYRASRLAERETIPASVRELTDAECLEL
jgi:ParB family chromosome partitioning protein